jgi:tetratricopeptide (TPR) repeat protein
LCLLASDLGFSSTFETSQRAEQGVNINANGFGAMVVNFEAIGRYFEHIGGDVLHQAGQPFLETSVFLAGFHFNDLPETQYAMDLLVNGRGHDFLYSLYDEVETMPFYMLLPFLQATRWDPMIFHHYIDSIVEHARENSVQLTEMLPTLLPAMAEIADNFYYVPGLPDIYYDICVFSQEVGEYRQTLEYYQKSLALFGPSDVKLYNMGVCHYLLGERDLALDNLQAALARNPEYTKAKELIAHIEQERQAASP